MRMVAHLVELRVLLFSGERWSTQGGAQAVKGPSRIS